MLLAQTHVTNLHNSEFDKLGCEPNQLVWVDVRFFSPLVPTPTKKAVSPYV